MKELILFLAKSLVSNKDAVEVSETPGDRAVTYEFKVDAAEVGKVIGREGKTIHAIRTVVQGAARAQGKRVLVEVAHGKKGPKPAPAPVAAAPETAAAPAPAPAPAEPAVAAPAVPTP